MKYLLLIISLLISAHSFAGKNCEDAVLMTTFDVTKSYIICKDVKDFCFNEVFMTTTSAVKAAQICKNVKSSECYDLAYFSTLKPSSAAALCKGVKSNCFSSVYTGNLKAATDVCRESNDD